MDPDDDDNPWFGLNRDIRLRFMFDIDQKRLIRERLRAIGLSRMKKRWAAAQLSILAEAVKAYPTGRWISYSRNKSFYRGKKRYHGTSYFLQSVTNAVDQAAEHGLLESRIAKPQSLLQSTFRATPKLVALFKDVNYEFRYYDVIRLRDYEYPEAKRNERGLSFKERRRRRKQTLVDYPDTGETIRMRKEVQKINRFMSTVRLDWPGLMDGNNPNVSNVGRYVMFDDKCVLLTDLRIYRSFSRGSFDLGGRCFGWWQSQSKEVRAQLLLNGEAVVEPDFSRYHPTMLYARRGIQLDWDAYAVPGFSREEIKAALLISINARSTKAAIPAVTTALRKKMIPAADKRSSAMIKAVKAAHPAIREDFCSDKGIELMKTDSDIIVTIMSTLVDDGIPFLPVHDSLLCRISDAKRVKEVMRESYSRAFPGFTCKVK